MVRFSMQMMRKIATYLLLKSASFLTAHSVTLSARELAHQFPLANPNSISIKRLYWPLYLHTPL